MKQPIDASEGEILLSNIKFIVSKDLIDSSAIVKTTSVFSILQYITKRLNETWKIG